MNAALEIFVERYRQHLQILNYSPRTELTRGGYLRLLLRFLAETEISNLQTVTGQTLTDFQRWLFYQPTCRGSMRSAAGQNQVLVAVKGFFRFLKEDGCVVNNPAEGLRYAKEPHRLPRNVLTPQECRTIMEAPDTQTLIGYRDRTILEVLYATGVRKSELMSLSLEDLNLEEELLWIRAGKGARDRVVPLSRIACSFLETYLKGIRPQLLRGGQSRQVFISLQARPLGRSAISYLVDKYAKRAGIQRHVTCHVWRHSCASHLVQNQANLRHVQEMLGHRSLATTERYLHLTITDLKQAHRKFHPREKDVAKQA
jgi:integrase/recombinase XerD